MISIVIPTFNAQDTIKDCLDAVCEFYDKDKIEIIICDNNSTDNTIFYLNNASLFFTKSMALSLFLIGQMYFKCKYSNKVYSLHTHYIIKKNSEWNLINRKERILKKNSLNEELKSMKKLVLIRVRTFDWLIYIW